MFTEYMILLIKGMIYVLFMKLINTTHSLCMITSMINVGQQIKNAGRKNTKKSILKAFACVCIYE